MEERADCRACDLSLHDDLLLFQRCGHLLGSIERQHLVFDLLQGKPQIFEGEDLVQPDHVPGGVQPAPSRTQGGGFEQALPVIVLQRADGHVHLLGQLAHGQQFFISHEITSAIV